MTKRNKVFAGVLGGAAGGVAMALGLYITSRIDLSRLPILRTFSDETDQLSFVGTSHGDRDGALSRSVLASAILGGAYGGLRSAFRLPGFLFGIAFGLIIHGLGKAGLGEAAKATPGPWNGRSVALLPRLVTTFLYGIVADRISERVEDAIAD